ncbi:MAG TPA: ABC transporter ATP-binding protein [Muricauda sp.]|nr:ABC transporter ATP-binding protein [uncultured Allomuricauda sp.]MAO16694.1 ABC transporter ATP-binding protein [Allomuricauda sp.]UBZ15669.1 ABC transporter ATP-binding protein [Allomuricauda aquimarina]HBU79037.1 ABC transporter ATP-binding protein [Allomuricauda sp.]|tara:strand:- start:1270 stop:2265 length:996 start_codon:yes stop_codon:yes gene_type:complete
MLKVQVTSFGYQDKTILKDISFQVAPGEHVALMGESGSGKSTLLKIVYGLLHVEDGSIFWGNTEALGPNFNLVPGEPYMKYLAQDFDLMPFISVEENIGQFLSVFERDTHQERIDELLDLIEMKSFAKTKVKYLSGGQQQRVALARVLAQEPEILLLDEPFGHIDNFKRISLRRNLFLYLKKQGITVLTASHDPSDVLPFAERTLILQQGRVIADKNTQDLYKNPPDYYTASLFGQVNQIPMKLLKSYSEIERSILVYPHEFKFSDSSGLKVEVMNSFFKGTHYLNEGMAEDGTVVFFNSEKEQEKGATIFLNVSLNTINKRLQIGQKAAT